MPLPKKVSQNVTKTVKLTSQKDKELPFIALQTLFREQLVAGEGKTKTSSSVADSNYERLYSMKTEPK